MAMFGVERPCFAQLPQVEILQFVQLAICFERSRGCLCLGRPGSEYDLIHHNCLTFCNVGSSANESYSPMQFSEIDCRYLCSYHRSLMVNQGTPWRFGLATHPWVGGKPGSCERAQEFMQFMSCAESTCHFLLLEIPVLLLWPIPKLFKGDRAARAASQVDNVVKAGRTT